jgi:hypothetical protein
MSYVLPFIHPVLLELIIFFPTISNVKIGIYYSHLQNAFQVPLPLFVFKLFRYYLVPFLYLIAMIMFYRSNKRLRSK